MFKRSCAIIFSLVLLIVSAGNLAASAATELISNGGFESGTTGFIAYGGWEGTYVSRVSDQKHSGSYSTKISTTTGGAPYIYQSVRVTGGDTYKISFWYKGEVFDKGFHIEMEEYNSSGRNFTEQSSPLLYTASDWTYVEHEFVPNENTVSMLVMPRITSSSATIYIDDISVQLVHEGPFQFSFDTDWVFYYEDYDRATVTLTMDDYYEDIGYTVDLTLKKGFKTLVSETGLTFTDNKLVYKLDITEMDEKKDYPLTVTVKDNTGTTVKTMTQNIYRINRPTALTKDGVYMVDGKPFDPVIAYHLYDAQHYESAKEGGINVIQWPASGTPDELIEQLDYIHSLGMKVLASPARRSHPAGHPSNAERTALVAETIKDHPAVFGYIIADEPFSHNAYADKELEESYRIIRYIDDVHPVYLCADHSYRRSSKYVDALGIDPYPGNGFDFGKHVGERTAEAIAGAKYERPVYTIVQAFTWVDGTPTTEQVRTQLFQALMAGASGIGYYVWENTTDGNLDKGPWWDTIKSFEHNDSDIMFEHFAREGHKTFSEYNDSTVWYRSKVSGEDIYMAIVNRTSGNKTVTVPLTSTNGKVSVEDYKLSVVNGGELSNVIQNSDSITVTLSAYQSVLYKITPAEVPDYSGLSDISVNGGFEGLTDGVLDGWGFAAGTGVTAPTQEEALKTDNSGNNYIYLTSNTSRVDSAAIGQPGKKYVFSVDYKATADRAARIDLDLSPTWREVTKLLPAAEEWTTANMILELTDEDNGTIVIRLRNWLGGSEVAFDNVSLVPLDPGDDIWFLSSDGKKYTHASEVSENITAYAKGLNKGDKFYLALYTELNGTDRLTDIAVVTAKDNGLISCTIDDVGGSVFKAKAFVWSENMGINIIKEIN